MTNTDNSRRKDDVRPAETLHWDTACSICAGAGTTFGKTCVCRAAEAKRASLTAALRCAALDLLEHNAAAGACIEIAGEPPLYVLVGAASAIGKLLPEAAAEQPDQVSGISGELDARAERAVVPEGWRVTLKSIADWLASSANDVQTGPDEWGPASQFDYELGQAAAEIYGLLAAPSSTEASAQAATDDVRNAALEEAAKLCEAIESDKFDAYKGRGKHSPNNPSRADTYVNGESDGAGQCAMAIRRLKTAAATPAQAVTEDKP